MWSLLDNVMWIKLMQPGETASARSRWAPVAVFMLLVGVVSAAEPIPSIRMRNWDVDAGLPSPRAFAVAQTPDGYVWVGSYSGLCRFDGTSFTVFTPRESLAIGDAAVTALAVDSEGVLWGGTERGYLFVRGRDGFESVAVPEAAGLLIEAICFHPDGTTWLATRGAAIAVQENETRVFGSADGLASSDVRQLVLDAAGTPWALAGGRVHCFVDGRWNQVTPGGAPRKGITAIAACRAGGVWCAERAARLPEGRASRVFRITAEAMAVPPELGSWPINPERSRIDRLGEDDEGRLWCGTRGGGVHCREPDGRWWPVGKETSLARADAISFATDQQGSVWIGTRSNGVYKAEGVPVHPMPLPQGLEDHVITTVAARKDGSLWAGTDGGGVVCWDGAEVRVFRQEHGLPSPWVTALAAADSGRLYAATLAGLAVFERDRFVDVPVRDRTGPIICSCLLPEGASAVWVGTPESTVRVDVNGPVEVRRGDGERLPTMCFIRDHAGRLLALGRDHAIYEFVPTSDQAQPDRGVGPDDFGPGVFEELVVEAAEPFSGGRVMAADAAGGIWLGSYGSGLARIADGRLHRWSQQIDRLPSSHVLSLVSAGGTIWVGAENGIYGCPVDEFAQSMPGQPVAVWRITQAEGLLEKVCTAAGQPAACVGPDGRVWMGNGRSIAGFLPADAMIPLHVFPPRVERVLADGIEVPFSRRVAPPIPVGTRRLDVRVTSPNTVAPQWLTFRHRLEGFDDDWVTLEDRRVVSYTGLPPGRYELSVEVRGPTGPWQGMADALPIRIMPRFWQRRDVQATGAVGLAGLLAAAGWAGERLRSKRRLERMRFEQARDQERQRIARDIHDDIGSGLTEIVMLSHLASREQGDSYPGSAINRIEDRARRLTRSMDEVVWAINPRNDSLEGFITYFHRWAQAFLSNAGLRVRWDLPLDPTEVALPAEVRHQLLLACKETVTNIVKHAGAQEVQIACHPRPDGLSVLIEDDGRGFAETESEPGRHGLGNLRTRLAEIGGRCEIESATGRGTRVRFDVTTTGRTIGATS